MRVHLGDLEALGSSQILSQVGSHSPTDPTSSLLPLLERTAGPEQGERIPQGSSVVLRGLGG